MGTRNKTKNAETSIKQLRSTIDSDGLFVALIGAFERLRDKDGSPGSKRYLEGPQSQALIALIEQHYKRNTGLTTFPFTDEYTLTMWKAVVEMGPASRQSVFDTLRDEAIARFSASALEIKPALRKD